MSPLNRIDRRIVPAPSWKRLGAWKTIDFQDGIGMRSMRLRLPKQVLGTRGWKRSVYTGNAPWPCPLAPLAAAVKQAWKLRVADLAAFPVSCRGYHALRYRPASMC